MENASELFEGSLMANIRFIIWMILSVSLLIAHAWIIFKFNVTTAQSVPKPYAIKDIIVEDGKNKTRSEFLQNVSSING